MRKGKLRFMLLVCLLALVPAQLAGAVSSKWILYDDFNTGIIDPAKWYGREVGSTGRETERLILSKKLSLLYRSYGNTDSNSGNTSGFTRLYFNINPSNIIGMKGTVKLAKKVETIGCDNNPDLTIVHSRLFGSFFNTGPATAGSDANNVYAYVEIDSNSTSTDDIGTAKIRAVVGKCGDNACSYDTWLELFNHDFGPITAGQQAVISIEWDQANHRFLFKRDKLNTVFKYDLKEYPDQLAPTSIGKRLDATCWVPNCTAETRPTGFINALFDDVYVKRSSF